MLYVGSAGAAAATAPTVPASCDSTAAPQAKPDVDDALPIRTDAKVAATTLSTGQTAVWTTSPDRHQYLVAPTGRVRVNGVEAQPRDGIAVTGESEISVEALDDAEVVLVDAR